MSLWAQLAVLPATVRIGLLHRFAYRLEVLTAAISSMVVVVLNGSIWTAVVEGREQLAGMRPDQVATYVVVAWIVTTVSATRLDEILASRFRSGEIACDLTKPLDLQLYLTGRDMGRAIASLALTAGPVLLAAGWIFPLVWPRSPITWMLMPVSLVLAVLIGAEIAFLVGIAAFRLKNVSGLAHLKATTTAVLSGAVVPLDAMPDGLREVVLWLPFQGMSHTPATLFLERLGAAGMLAALALQLGWVLVLLMLCRLAWRWALNHLTVQGG